MQRILQLRAEIKYSTLSLLSIVLVFAFHAIHWMLVPLMLGTVEMEAHHHMNRNTSHLNSWFAFVVWLFNGIAIFFACKLLWSAWKGRRKGWHSYKYIFISAVSFVISVLSLVIL